MIPLGGLDDPRLEDFRHVADHDALVRRGLFVAEGRLVVERLVARRRHRVRSLLLSATAAEAMAAVLRDIDPATAVFVVPQAEMNDVVGFNIHRGCLALAERPGPATLGDLDLTGATRLVVLEGVNNPDNVGGVFRNAAALGAAAVVLGPHCGDPLYRKAIRTSMAAVLTLPWVQAGPWPDALARLRAAGFSVVACTPAAQATALYDADLPVRAAVLVGAEGPGLSAEALAHADLQVRIPMHGAIDSLNVATAAAVVLSALAAGDTRQRP
ncbi:MAG TPA: RNA methyltransferase [Vicinamibacterales bacterium]|nr:RNA methyltransferase [Vicinamibacterales bacterium]